MQRFLLLSLFCLSISLSHSQSVQIIPKPTSLSVHDGHFVIDSKTKIIASTEKEKLSAAFLNDYLQSYYGFKLSIRQKGKKGIVIKTVSGKGNEESYTLESGKKAVVIKGHSDAGTFYGVQTLIQLLPVTKSQSLSIASVSVTDQPDMKYRGLHLDVSRHFFPVSFIKKYIDYIALHKMNTFHFHLTDDQGWRIEIKKYPELTSVGGWRNGTIIGNFPGSGNDKLRYGGFYTQEDIKDIVKYASDRFVTVIPEIEMPGHASAAIAAYPFLSCFPEKSSFQFFMGERNKAANWAGDTTGKSTMQSFGVYSDIFCAGKESTFEFLQNVLDEVLPLFPSKYVHIGGDEAPKSNWEKCPNCQKRIRDLNVKTDAHHKAEHYLQSYFIQRIEKYLNAKGKTIIGWDEILEGGLAPNAIVMSWRGEDGGIEAAKLNHEVIMTPNSYMYFDHQQTPKDDSVTISNNNGYLPIEKVYGWSIVPEKLPAAQRKYVLGGQANLWTEYIKNPQKVEYMLFPRIAALSEALWTPRSSRNLEDFKTRLDTQKKRYDLWGVNYFGKQK
ncbi:MAG: beta-N-acetylhexosaminidase [Niabella sp.]